ncbi:extensin-like [Salvia splendens]|uniref:extensin-like n=1 Tax=Salvia splendens TaxID=180675 RepID=UPI001C27415E|nr:extensin-like [Salvia splendens]
MSYGYTGYQLWQADYHPWQPVPQPLLHPIRALDQQPSYPYPQDVRLHPQPHPYQARQPTCWDPPWLCQETAYQQTSSYETDLYSPPPPSFWDPPRLCTQQGYSQPYQPPQQPHHTALRQPTSWDPPAYWETTGQRPFHEVSAYDRPLPPNHNSGWNQPAPQPTCPATTTAHPILAQLQQLLEACYRMESHLVAADRCIENMLPPELPEPAQPYGSQIFEFGDLVQHLPPSGNSKASPRPSGLVPYDSLAPPRQSSKTPPPFEHYFHNLSTPSKDYHQQLSPPKTYQPPPPSALIPDCD